MLLPQGKKGRIYMFDKNGFDNNNYNVENFEFPTLEYIRKAFNQILPNHIYYDLRTTFYTRCEECGVSPPARDHFVGHSSGVLNSTYTDLSDEYLLKEGTKLVW